MAPPTPLSSNDSRILAALFDPETLPSSVARTRDAALISPSLPPLPSLTAHDLAQLESVQNSIIARATATTATATTPAGMAALTEAIAALDAVVEAHPAYPSARVNRAMLRRMVLEGEVGAAGAGARAASETGHKDDNDAQGTEERENEKESIFAFHPPAKLTPLFTDLAAAISLCLPTSSPTSTTSPTASAQVSPYAARILRTALSHRAYLYLKAAEAHAAWDGAEGAELEERASVDFAGAARYGDEVAREMSVRTNPYARACGGIVREALRGEKGGVGV